MHTMALVRADALAKVLEQQRVQVLQVLQAVRVQAVAEALDQALEVRAREALARQLLAREMRAREAIWKQDWLTWQAWQAVT